MKRIFLALVLLCTMSFVQAQDIPFIDVGIRGGVNLSTVTNLPQGLESNGALAGFAGGAFARIKIPLVGLFVQPEIMYSSLGGKLKDAVGAEGDLLLNNLDFAAMIGYNLGLGPLGVRLGVAPVLSNVLSSKVKIGGVELDVKDETNSPLWSVQFGVGADISKLTFDLRYQLGLSKLYNDDNQQNSGTIQDVRSNAIQFTIGYKFL